jgi:WD40 repeat protein
VEGNRAIVGRMQAAVRGWVLRAASGSTRGLRGIPLPVLLSLLCASALSPLFVAAGAGAAGLAGVGVMSSVSGGVLSEIIAGVLERTRSSGEEDGSGPAETEGEIAAEIGRLLAAGDATAQALRAEIAKVLREIDAGGTVLRAVIEQGNEQVRSDVIAAIGGLGLGFDELGFLVADVAAAAAEIQASLDAQGANVRAIIEQNDRQSTDIRLVREDLAVIARHSLADVPGAAAAGGGPRWVHGCPYRGLLPFEETDAEVYHGRERLTAELAVKLAAQVTRSGLVVVTGASGAGKSSLLRAGLVPALARGKQVTGSGQWPRIVMTPTPDPLTELATRLAVLGGGDTAVVRDGLAQHPGQAHLAVRQAVLAEAARRDHGRVTADGGVRLVLIVDQFEQVFTLNSGPGGEAGRQAFITALCAAAASPAGPEQAPPALVVIAVRGDFWDRCAPYPELARALKDGPFVVGPMTESELRLAITGPADAAGLHIDPALADTILADLHAAGGDDTTGALPLLSQAMSLTWDKRDGNQLTSHGYGQVGGVSHAVQTSADGVYDNLPAGQQALAREILRAMTVASRDGRLTRRPVTRAALYTGHPDTEASQIDAVLETFAASRLIVFSEGTGQSPGTAQIAHDALLSAWPRLRGWLDDDRATWILHSQLTDDAATWHDNHNDPSFLYRKNQLAASQQAAARWSADPARYPALTTTQRDFLRASQRAATRSSRQRRAAAAVLALLTLAASITSVVAYQQRTTANQQRNLAIYNQVVAEAAQLTPSDPSLAAQLNLTAYRMPITSSLASRQDLISRLLATENTPLATPVIGGDSIESVAFSPDGRTLAAATGGTIRLWDMADPARPRALGPPVTVSTTGRVFSVAFSPDGRTLASGDYDGLVRLWDVTDPAHPRALGPPLAGRIGALTSVAFSPEDPTLADASVNGMIQLWNVADPARPRALGPPLAAGTGAVFSVAFSRDGRTMASGSNDGTVRLWNVTTPARPRALGPPLTDGGFAVFSVAFSPDGRTLASGSYNNEVRLWNVSDAARPRMLSRMPGSIGGVYSVVFSRDGRTLASAGADGTIQLWNTAIPADSQPIGPSLTVSTGAVHSVAFSPDGRTLAGAGQDGTVRLWGIPQTVLNVSGGEIPSVAFSPDGRTLASTDVTVRLWNVTDPAHPRTLGPLPGATRYGVLSVAFSRDSRILASGGADGTVRLWNVADPAHPRSLGPPLTVSRYAVESVAFSPDGPILASAVGDGTVRLWNVADPAHPRSLGPPLTVSTAGAASSVAFSPDGRILAAGNNQDGTVQLWNMTDPAHPRAFGSLPGNTGYGVFSVAFSPDGHTLTAGGYNGTIQSSYIVSDDMLVGSSASQTSNSGVVYSVAFRPHTATLASGSADGKIQLWNVASPSELEPQPIGQPLTSSTGAVFSVAFSPDGGTLASGGEDGTVRLWNLNVNYAIERICTTTRNDLTPEQWHQYIPQLPYQPPCASYDRKS